MANDTKPPLPPPGLGFCSECRHWIVARRQQLFVQPNGNAMPKTEAVKQGIPLSSGQIVDMAPCSWMPVWAPAQATMWCAQWAAHKPAELPAGARHDNLTTAQKDAFIAGKPVPGFRDPDALARSTSGYSGDMGEGE